MAGGIFLYKHRNSKISQQFSKTIKIASYVTFYLSLKSRLTKETTMLFQARNFSDLLLLVVDEK